MTTTLPTLPVGMLVAASFHKCVHRAAALCKLLLAGIFARRQARYLSVRSRLGYAAKLLLLLLLLLLRPLLLLLLQVVGGAHAHAV
jgi:hypothetical protein